MLNMEKCSIKCSNLCPLAQIAQFPFKAFSHRVNANEGQSRMSFLMALLEWKCSKICSSSGSSSLGWPAIDAIASCNSRNFSSKVGWSIPSAPPVATCMHFPICTSIIPLAYPIINVNNPVVQFIEKN